MSDKLLRFAALVRVSSESKEKKGESLRTQRADIERAVKSLGGVLIPDPWRYSGQEHATPEVEHKRFDQLLRDAPRNIFDAVIVWDPSRWSRDNLNSKQGIQILKRAGIRFFVLQVEQNLFDPTAAFFLGVSVEVGEYVAMLQTQKSVLNRIARASRSEPTAGKLPYGRTFNKETKVWGIDEEKRKKIVWAAQEYLKGESRDKLARMIGIHPTNLHTILTRRCGDTWDVRFRSKRLAIDEKVTLQVPPLLPPETIRRIKERVEDHKGIKKCKHQYLLSRRVFCKKCGHPMFGQVNQADTRYYRHRRGKGRGCDLPLWCPADQLEEAVMVRLFAIMGDKAGLEAAMLRAIPDRKKVEELKRRRDLLEKELSKVGASKDRLIQAVTDGLFSKEEVSKRMEDVREREQLFRAEIEGITSQLREGPTEEEVRGKAKMLSQIIGQIYRLPSRLAKMGFEERQKLISILFDGKDAQGRRFGVYLERDGKTEPVRYEIRGAFGESFKGTVTPDGVDILDFKDVPMEYLEDLKEAVKTGNSKLSNSVSKD